jgi:hypothetical protein
MASFTLNSAKIFSVDRTVSAHSLILHPPAMIHGIEEHNNIKPDAQIHSATISI